MPSATGSPRMETLGQMSIIGTEIRTTNLAEGEAGTAKIGANWQKFYQESLSRIPNRCSKDVVLGVYARYAGDYRGEYSHIAGCEVSEGTRAPGGMVALNIPEAKYLVFTAQGEMPAVVAKTWDAIWQYFELSDSKRAYTFDLERYDQREPSRIDIYIAIK